MSFGWSDDSDSDYDYGYGDDNEYMHFLKKKEKERLRARISSSASSTPPIVTTMFRSPQPAPFASTSASPPRSRFLVRAAAEAASPYPSHIAAVPGSRFEKMLADSHREKKTLGIKRLMEFPYKYEFDELFLIGFSIKELIDN